MLNCLSKSYIFLQNFINLLDDKFRIKTLDGEVIYPGRKSSKKIENNFTGYLEASDVTKNTSIGITERE